MAISGYFCQFKNNTRMTCQRLTATVEVMMM